MIQDPTHFTENSSSLIDLLIVNNKNRVTTCGVGESFLTNIYVTIVPYTENLTFASQNKQLSHVEYGNTIMEIMT